MTSDDKKLLKLCLNGLENRYLDQKNYKAFSKDYAKYAKDEITFRELIAAVKEPQGDLKEAMRSYYGHSKYQRVFKNSR